MSWFSYIIFISTPGFKVYLPFPVIGIEEVPNLIFFQSWWRNLKVIRSSHKDILLPGVCPQRLLAKVFAPNFLKLFSSLILFLLLHEVLGPGPRPGVHHVTPVPLCVFGKFFPPLNQKNTGIANFSNSVLPKVKATSERVLILWAVCESWTKGIKGQISTSNYKRWFHYSIYLLDFVLQIQQPSKDRNTLGLWKVAMILKLMQNESLERILSPSVRIFTSNQIFYTETLDNLRCDADSV